MNWFISKKQLLVTWIVLFYENAKYEYNVFKFMPVAGIKGIII